MVTKISVVKKKKKFTKNKKSYLNESRNRQK